MNRSRQTLILVFLLGLLAAGLALTMVRSNNTPGAPSQSFIIAVIIGLVSAMFLVFLIVRSIHKRKEAGRRQTLQEAAEQLNLTLHPQVPEVDVVTGLYYWLPEIPKRAKAKNLIEGSIAGRRLLLFQATYIVHTGQAAVPITHTIYGQPTPNWPATSIVRRNALSRFAYALGWRRSSTLVESAEFNRTFKVKSEDEDFAITLLSPDMQGFMLENPRIRWRFDRMQMCLVYKGAIRADKIAKSVDRLKRFWSLTPPELELWESTDDSASEFDRNN